MLYFLFPFLVTDIYRTPPDWIADNMARLKGRQIVAVRYMSQKEAREYDWLERAPVLMLDDGTKLWPCSDDEGNNAGALAVEGVDGDNWDLPTMT